MAGGTFASQIVLWPFIKKHFDIKLVTWNETKKHIKPLLILFIPAIAVSLYKYMDKIMLGIMTTKTQVGFYENAERAINIPISIIGAFGTVMLPKMSNLAAKKDEEESQRYIMLSMEFIMCLTIAMAFGMAAVANSFSLLFWGDQFAECGALIQVLSFSVIFLAFANILRMQYLIPQKKDWIYIMSVFTGAFVNLIINALLISKLQALGAALGTVAAELSVCAVQTICVSSKLPVKVYIKKAMPFLGFGVLMYITLFFIEKMGFSLISEFCIQLILGCSVYCLCCFLYFKKINHEYFNVIINKFKGYFSG